MENEGKRTLHKRIFANLVFSLLVIVLLILLVPGVLKFFMPLIIAWIIASIANPLVVFLEDRIKIMRKHGTVIVIVAVLGLVGGLFYLALYAIGSQIYSLAKDFPQIYHTIVENLQLALVQVHNNFKFIPNNVQELLTKYADKFGEIIMSFLKNSKLSSVGSIASSVLDVFILTILSIMFAYFFVAKREEIKEGFRKYTPNGIKNFCNIIVNNCLKAVGGYLKACFKIMIVIFFILWIIFSGIMRAKYGVLLALLTAFMDFLPFLGTGVIITPWAIYCFIMGDYVSVVVLVISYVICLVVHRLLEPKLIGDSVGMSPFGTLLSMFIGYRLIGMLGLIIGIPVGMILKSLVEENVFESQIRGIKILAKDFNEYRKY